MGAGSTTTVCWDVASALAQEATASSVSRGTTATCAGGVPRRLFRSALSPPDAAMLPVVNAQLWMLQFSCGTVSHGSTDLRSLVSCDGMGLVLPWAARPCSNSGLHQSRNPPRSSCASARSSTLRPASSWQTPGLYQVPRRPRNCHSNFVVNFSRVLLATCLRS